MSYFMETICKLYIGGCIAAGEGEGETTWGGGGGREGGRQRRGTSTPALQGQYANWSYVMVFRGHDRSI